MQAGEKNGELWEWHTKTGWKIVPGSEASGANGIEISKDGKTFYMAGWGNQVFIRLSRGATPVRRDEIPIGFRLDNLRWAPDGTTLIGAGQQVAADGAAVVASRVVRIDPKTLKVFAKHYQTQAPIPADLAPDELTPERAEELLAKGAIGPRVLGDDPETGMPVLALTGRFGPFVQLGEVQDGSKEKPKRASLFASMEPASVTLHEALALLSLPRVVGTDASDTEITAQNGRYGPYLKKGTETRSLASEDQLFTVTLGDAEALFAQPKQRRGRVAKPPLADLGQHPESGAPVRVLDGRYGPYVTDGTTNASVPRGSDPESITLEQGVELLRERAARAPAAKRTVKKAAKKRTAKKRTATKVVKKRAAKKTAKKVAGKATL
jgi:topoisomerase IA-like protein